MLCEKHIHGVGLSQPDAHIGDDECAQSIAFGALYDDLHLPVVVCRRDDDSLLVVYTNEDARVAFAPECPLSSGNRSKGICRLEDILRFKNRGMSQAFTKALLDGGCVHRLDTELLSFQGEALAVRLYANAGRFAGVECFVVYAAIDPESYAGDSIESFLSASLNACHYIADINDAIQTVLGMAGDRAGASRTYIFEEFPPDIISNTYEWCAEGVPPVMREMQRMPRSTHEFAILLEQAETIVADDISRFPETARRMLEAQKVKSVAVMPLRYFDRRLGYIGFDDCARRRGWSMGDVQTLQCVAGIVASLISRRNVQSEARRSMEMIKTVTDNLDDLVYISDIDTMELRFVSKSLAAAAGMEVEDILGKPCWQVLHRDQSGPCSFCPLATLLEREAQGESGPFVWELHNNMTGKWYMVKDSIVNWIDNGRAHLGTFIDITYRKQYEEQLRRFAATDAMTDVYNRKWGYGKLDDLFQMDAEARGPLSLCFIDVDGLKRVNDTQGHAAGDEMLISIVGCVFANIRREDFVCRWGGDEFILALHCGIDDAMRVMNKVIFALDHFNATRGKPYKLSISHGLVDFSMPFGCLDELIDEADRRMYENKMAKRRSVSRMKI